MRPLRFETSSIIGKYWTTNTRFRQWAVAHYLETVLALQGRQYWLWRNTVMWCLCQVLPQRHDLCSSVCLNSPLLLVQGYMSIEAVYRWIEQGCETQETSRWFITCDGMAKHDRTRTACYWLQPGKHDWYQLLLKSVFLDPRWCRMSNMCSAVHIVEWNQTVSVWYSCPVSNPEITENSYDAIRFYS
jgi:hypothetical protein